MAKLFIKNMVCDRCVAAVEQILNESQIPFESVVLGEVAISVNSLTENQTAALRSKLEHSGFELLETQNAQLVSKIKNAVLQWARGESGKNKRTKLSTYLSELLNKDYPTISKLFSEIESITIEQYLIKQKIERAKELLVYDELSLSQIADELNYSSVSHLSNQFKKITGLTPKHFKSIGAARRLSVDKV